MMSCFNKPQLKVMLLALFKNCAKKKLLQIVFDSLPSRTFMKSKSSPRVLLLAMGLRRLSGGALDGFQKQRQQSQWQHQKKSI